MECPSESRHGAELWIGYVAGTLVPEVELGLRLHLEACQSCREAVKAQEAVWSALDHWTPVSVSPSFDEALFRRIANEEQAPRWRRLLQARWSWRPVMPLAAFCAALIVAFFLRTPPAEAPSMSRSAPAAQIEQVERVLDDMDMLKQMSATAKPQSPADRL